MMALIALPAFWVKYLSLVLEDIESDTEVCIVR